MKMYVGTAWSDRPRTVPVTNPFDGSQIDTVPRGNAEDVDIAISTAVKGADEMARLPGYERYLILRRAAQLLEERIDDLGRTITLEEGKTIAEGRGEVGRAVQTITGSAEEAKRIHGETVPLDGAPGITRQFGFTMRVPCGVVAAICPFNFPLNLVCHKVGPGHRSRQRSHHQARQRYAPVCLKADRDPAGSRHASQCNPVHHRTRCRDRRRHLFRPPVYAKLPSPAAAKWESISAVPQA